MYLNCSFRATLYSWQIYEWFTFAGPLTSKASYPCGFLKEVWQKSLRNVTWNIPSNELLKDNIRRYLAKMAMSSHIRCCSNVGVGDVHVLSISWNTAIPSPSDTFFTPTSGRYSLITFLLSLNYNHYKRQAVCSLHHPQFGQYLWGLHAQAYSDRTNKSDDYT